MSRLEIEVQIGDIKTGNAEICRIEWPFLATVPLGYRPHLKIFSEDWVKHSLSGG